MMITLTCCPFIEHNLMLTSAICQTSQRYHSRSPYRAHFTPLLLCLLGQCNGPTWNKMLIRFYRTIFFSAIFYQFPRKYVLNWPKMIGCPMYPEDVASRNLWAYASGLCEPFIYKSQLRSHLRFALSSHSLHTAGILWCWGYRHIKQQRPNHRLQPNRYVLSVRLVWYCRGLPTCVMLPSKPLLRNILESQRRMLMAFWI